MSLQVQLILPSGARRSVQLPDEVIVGRLLPALVSKLELPLLDESGQALRYELVAVKGSLDPEETLAAARVAPDSELRLVAAVRKWDLPVAEPPRPASFGPPVLRLTQADIDTMLAAPEPEQPIGWWNILAASGIALLAGIFIVLGFSGLGTGAFFSDAGQPAMTSIVVTTASATVEPVNGWVSSINTTAWPEVLDLAQIGDLVFLLQKGDQETLLWQIRLNGEQQLLSRLTLYPGKGYNSLAVVDDTLYFWDGPQRQLWRYVPATGVMAPVGFLRPGAGHLPLPINDHYLYGRWNRADRQALYTTATPEAEAESLPVRVDPGWHLDTVISSGYLYFVGFEPETGYELWRTDGTTAGTELVQDIHTGRSSSAPHQLTLVDNYIYFAATDATHGMELWRTYAPSGTTQLVADLQEYEDAELAYLTVIADQLYFTATSSNRTHQLWRYDLAEGQFSLLEPTDYDISPATHQVGHNGELLYFLAADSSRLGRLALTDSDYSWLFTEEGPAPWSELYVSSAQLLLQDTQGRTYQYLEGAEAATWVTNVNDVADVLTTASGDFLLLDSNDRLWRLAADQQQAEFILHAYALKAGDG
ncbi:MAG: hypothetical protein KDE34_03210 [Anaerolineales bacterium]|nr:hypothetical protein [Anaerolineales bacterium]MCB8961965.1 hypothetical protein [Ardenticatenales bacterium]